MKSRTLGFQVPMYLLMGGLNTLFAYLLFALFIWLGMHYTLATLFPGIISIYLGYVVNKHIVFNARKTSRFSVLYYYLFYGVVYLANISIQTTMHALGSANDYVNGAVAMAIMTVVTFAVNKWFFFKDSQD